MVVLLDLAEEPRIPPHHAHYDSFLPATVGNHPGFVSDRPTTILSRERDQITPTSSPFSAALRCYPIVLQLAQHLDLNDLHGLSATCRQFRASLLPLRHQLIPRTLRCVNEVSTKTNAPFNQFMNGEYTVWLSGRVVPCARDLVAPCQACSRVVCRNCTAKPVRARQLLYRHRRLCPTCADAPLETLIGLDFKSSLPEDAALKPSSTMAKASFDLRHCQCAESIYLCVPCGNTINTADTTYDRVWTWRTRYGNIGGMYNGIGEGNEGVQCGRGSHCLAATCIEVEVDVDTATGSESSSCSGTSRHSPTATRTLDLVNLPLSAEMNIQTEIKGPIYGTREIEGIGGVVKKKLITSVKIGACVPEWDEEREKCTFLAREKKGQDRSWCSWCNRVILGPKDRSE